MSLHKIYNFVGYNNLGLLLEQERKHWLLKPDKKLNVQDSATGSIFQGRLDNMGNEIVVETNKTNAYTGSDMFMFTENMFNNVFEPLSSTLPYNNSLNGLMYECIISSKIAYRENNTTSYKNYKLKFVDCEEVLIPFGDSLETSNVYAGKWIKTTTNPYVILPDNSNVYNIEIQLEYEDSVDGCVFYYPLEENMQPLSLDNPSSGVYITEAVTDSTFIGYPIYWFTSDNTNVGPTVEFSNNESDNHTLLYLSNPGNVSKYYAQIFCSVDGNEDAAPYGESTSDWKIVCKTITGAFTETYGDIMIPIDMNSIKLVRVSDNTEYDIPISSDNDDVLTLTSIDLWARSGNTAWSLLSNYDRNCYNTQKTEHVTYELIPLFNLHLDENVTFLHNTTDVGYAGIHMSSEPYLESGERYPYDLSQWDGIPEWLRNNEEGAPQHVALYAIHNTPNYNENDPKTRQTTAILLDPGKQKTSEDESFSNDERGRAYLLSNDEAVYDNNATSENPKPPRTIARMCDIPYTITQLTNISGLAPTTVVDKNYVHTDACYTENEKNKVWNILSNKWVRPSMVDGDGAKISDRESYNNEYIFNTIDDLNDVDLYSVTNDLCEYINLNPMVNPNNIDVDRIVDAGHDYEPHDTGVIIIGGASLTYTVNTVDESGGVTDVTIAPTASRETLINLSNFDMVEGSSHTGTYGTSPVVSNNGGVGLTLSLIITNYDDIKTKRGDVYDDLFALVRHPDGLWLYQYTNTWEKRTIVSEAESSTIVTTQGGLSTTDAYMTSIVSTIRPLPINILINNKPSVSVNVLDTPSFINVIDNNHIPFTTSSSIGNNKVVVDINKLVCKGVFSDGVANQKSGPHVIKWLKDHNKLMYDSYVFWRWIDPDLQNGDTRFEYGIIYRSFNNFQSTDTTTLLPSNTLNCDSYVHSNEQTTIVWHVDGIGAMMWIYDSINNIHETYTQDSNTADITITKQDRLFTSVDIYNDPSFSLVDTTGKLLFNIWTNNPIQATSWSKKDTDPIYQQPEFVELGKIGDPINNVQPVGCWRLVYPRVNKYTFTNGTASYDAIKMDVIHGENLGNIGNIKNQYDQIVNKKILVLDRQTRGTAMRVYNDQTNNWDDV